MSTLPDRRLNAYRADLAESRLRGVVEAERYVEGSVARVSVPVTPLRAKPDLACGTDTELLLRANRFACSIPTRVGVG